jgi:hypothetical protein
MNFVRALPILVVGWLGGCNAALDPGAGPTQDGGPTAGGTFACGPYQCDTATEYCYETFTCIAEADADLSGGNVHSSCLPIPTQCYGKSEKGACSCTLHSLGGTDGDNPFAGSGITPDPSGAAGGCTLGLNCV